MTSKCDNNGCIGGKAYRTDESVELDPAKEFCSFECADEYVNSKQKIKVTVRKRLPCPQCGKGNMFDYYNHPSEDDVCSDCDESPVTNVEFDSDKIDDALWEQGLDWTFDKPDDEDQYSCIYIVHREKTSSAWSIRPTCEKCPRRVPDKYYHGLADDELWIECKHNGWYCPDHSPTCNCGDESCICCNAYLMR